jgi:AraC-like DNA-binding protein
VYRTNEIELRVTQPCIIFFNREVAYSWESVSEDQRGFYCLFNDAFLPSTLKQHVKYNSPLFNPEIPPYVMLDEEGVDRISHYFSEMKMLLGTAYTYKFDMIRHLLLLLIHEGARMQHGLAEGSKSRSTDRLVNSFLNILDHQFPVDSPENPLRLVAPAVYAEKLNVHVNHLNAMVKKHTGKTTREIIKEKIVAEAKKLLLHTDWDAAQIGYSLGFEYPSHFHKYFKQHTGISPQAFRQEER